MCIGFALFHTQHVFNPGYVRTGEAWSFKDAALRGSSLLTIVPWWARWATLGIEYHHIHHLTTKVPGYRLRACHEALPAQQWLQAGVRMLGWVDVVKSMGYTVYDTELNLFT